MPAYTVAQLEPMLSQYLAPQASFTTTLAQVLPRIYAMGMWRDLVFETSLNAAAGYVSLPADAESVISCTVNDNPRPVRSLWSDVKIIGRQPVVSPYFGIVDDGFHATALDMKDVQDVASEEDVILSQTLFAVPADGDREYFTSIPTGWAYEPAGRISVSAFGDPGLGNTITTEEAVFDGLHWAVTFPDGFMKVTSIRYEGLTEEMDIYCGSYEKPIATLPVGTGVYRVRRFRVSDVDDDTTVHLLLKRGCPSEFSDNTIIHLGNLQAIKHGFLGTIAEDNSDLERANYHWDLVRQLLDEELDAFRGAAKPTLTLNIWGDGAKPFGLY